MVWAGCALKQRWAPPGGSWGTPRTYTPARGVPRSGCGPGAPFGAGGHPSVVARAPLGSTPPRGAPRSWCGPGAPSSNGGHRPVVAGAPLGRTPEGCLAGLVLERGAPIGASGHPSVVARAPLGSTPPYFSLAFDVAALPSRPWPLAFSTFTPSLFFYIPLPPAFFLFSRGE